MDNIEVPNRYCSIIKKDKKLQKEFIGCLYRISKNFVEEMKHNGMIVEQVTIGKGYNDLKDILDKYFKLVNNPKMLSGYNGYSDAHLQYKIN